MKRVILISAPCAAWLLAGCDTGGFSSSGSYDPLDPAGGFGNNAPLVDSGFRPGSFVVTSMDNAAFFRERPEGDATADRLLPGNTPVKVISDDGSYVKVELDSGESGYMPSVMLVEQGGASMADPYNDGEVQVWPPPPGGELPPEIEPIDPDAPTIPPTIDPDAPSTLPPLPDDAPTPGLGIEPALPDDPPAPEPGEDEESPPEPGEGDEAAAVE